LGVRVPQGAFHINGGVCSEYEWNGLELPAEQPCASIAVDIADLDRAAKTGDRNGDMPRQLNIPLIPPVHTFAPVGYCIYCSQTEGLTDEHIIAYGLNGKWVLPKASCVFCREEKWLRFSVQPNGVS
jgi:hypothetical protein